MTNQLTIIQPHILFTDQTTTTINPIKIRPHIVFTDWRHRQTQPWYDHILSLLTNENKNEPNHNTTTYFVYWRTTTTNPTIIQPHIVFTDWRQRTTKPTIIRLDMVFTDGRENNKPNHHTTTYSVYWMTTSKNPMMIRPYIVFTVQMTTIIPIITRPYIVLTDGRQQS